MLRLIFGWHFNRVELILGKHTKKYFKMFFYTKRGSVAQVQDDLKAKVEATHLTPYFKLYIASHCLCLLFHHSLSL